MDDPPNVLVLVSDQHNHRCLGFRDDEAGEPVSTPTFDRLATAGVDFDRAYCPMPLCTPSRMCFLTGRRVPGAGAWSNGSWLRPELATLPGTFADAGYETCLVGKMHLGGDRQFAGFEHRPYGDLLGGNGHQYDPVSPEDRGYATTDPIGNENAGITDYPESQLQEGNVVRETLAFLREHRHRSDDPWFLCASFSRPHDPYTTPPRHFERYEGDVPEPRVGPGDGLDHPVAARYREGYAGEEPDVTERARAAYFANVDYLDEFVGDLLALLDRDGFLEDTIVVYLSDHGDMIGEQGMWRKSVWFEGSTRVPWLVELPVHRAGDLAGATVSTPVSLVDLYPTLCGLCGVDAPDDLDGVDLSAAVRTGEEPDRGPVVTDNFSGMDYRMVRDGDYKYVRFRDAPEVLIDLADDPLERRNAAPDASGADAEALERLRAFVDETLDFEAIDERRERDRERAREHRIGVPTGIAGNAYRLRTDQIVDAGIVVTKPDVLVERPGRVLEDDPAAEREGE